jgi:hypothetical protein
MNKILVLVVAVLACFLWFAVDSYTSCQEVGGQLVRGLFWFVCVTKGTT